ncbi:hypothetical protein N2152v2_010114 [Parachlorella kessleri]
MDEKAGSSGPPSPAGASNGIEVVREGSSIDLEMQQTSHSDLLRHRHQPNNGTSSPEASAAAAGASGGSAGDQDGKPAESSKELQPSEGSGEMEPVVLQQASYWDIAKYFGMLGWTAFGGPAAHITMFLQLFVEKLHWTTHLVFTELLMLGQCMPGPTSTQMAFAIGVLKKGLSGGLLSGMLFQAPGLIILTILGWVASKVLDNPPDWLLGVVAGLAAAGKNVGGRQRSIVEGLFLVAADEVSGSPPGIALVASAARELVAKICKDRLNQTICVAAAVIAYYYPKPWTFPSLIVAGGLITLVFKRKDVIKVEEVRVGVERLGFNKLWGSVLLASWIVVLVLVVVFAGRTDYNSHKELHWFTVFYRVGSVIFGGGQVVLPMLYNDMVTLDCSNTPEGQKCPEAADSWMTQDQFYAGLALAQAMPGPLFNFAAYLGAVLAQNAGVFVLVGVALCWIGLFAPGIILIFGILPWWGMFRQWQVYRRALPGLNSAAVGLIVTSVFQLTLSAFGNSPFPHASISIGIMAYGATEVLKIPAPLVVIGGGVCGVIGWGAGMN